MRFSLQNHFFKTAFSVLLAAMMLGFALHFLASEGVQIGQIRAAFARADGSWLALGVGLSAAYVWLHGEMYRLSFWAIGRRVRLGSMARLYLKRNFVGVFLPAGFLSSQGFFGTEIERSEGVSEGETLAASGIYSAASLASMIVAVVPALGWLLSKNLLPNGAAAAFLALTAAFVGLIWAVASFFRQGRVSRFFEKKWPALAAKSTFFVQKSLKMGPFVAATAVSCAVEAVGTAHVFVAARALGASPTWEMAFAGYVAVLVVLMTSPFLRGIGAVEALLAAVLMRLGLPSVEAVSAAILFRFFEFWIVLMLALPVFLVRPGNLALRLGPSALLFLLGGVDILSGLTPALTDRTRLLREYLPLEAMHASAWLTVAVGFVLLVTAFYLFRGLRSAWWLAVGLCAVSLASHLTKGFDYEEAILALVTLAALVYQRGQYSVRSDLEPARRGWLPALIAVKTALALGAVGFWLLGERHFGSQFSWGQSAAFSLRTFLMIDSPSLRPLDFFGAEFLQMLHFLGAMTLVLIAFWTFRPFFPKMKSEAPDRQRALEIVAAHGHSSLDYFKTSGEKQFFFTENGDSFVAFKNTARYALALENPVAPNAAAMRASVAAFSDFCHRQGLRPIFYRVGEADAAIYRSLGKSVLPLGQEASVDLTAFSLEGRDRKALRNALHRLEKDGFRFVARRSPHRDGFLQQLRAVSDDWLRSNGRAENSFSQGFFDENALRKQPILTVESSGGKIFAFLNLVPGGSEREANFDLMRRTADAPHGTMDFLFVNMFDWLKKAGFETVNLGLVPLSGLAPKGFSEHLLKLAYERLPIFSGYKSLRFFKEKFDPVWQTRYVAYENALDLVNLPLALGRVEHG